MRSALRVIGRVVRVPALLRVVVAYGLFILTEYAVWIAVLVYAYGNGGATEAGLVALVQLVPATLTAPVVAALADRFAPGRLMAAAYGAQALGTGWLAVAVLAGSPPLLAYAGAVLAATAVAAIRPAQTALVPALTRSVAELTATNVVLGWLESVSIVLAGLVTGLALAADSLWAAFAGSAVLLVVALGLVAGIGARAAGVAPTNAFEHFGGGLKQVAKSRPSRLLVALLGLEYVLIGALDVLFVVVAVERLQQGTEWAGYLNTAFGAGGVVLGSLAAFLVGRRLGPVICISALTTGLALAATLFFPGPVAVVLLLMVVGGARAMFDVATRTLLQRAVPADMVARVFGVAEGLSMGGLAVGSLLTPLLVAIGGGRLALAGVAAVLPLMVLARVRMVLSLDDEAQVPVVEISLLRSLRIFRELPSAAMEALARSLVRLDVSAGAVVVSQGDEGRHYYAIAEGELEVWRDGERVRALGRGEGAGEIALLQGAPRSATLQAVTPVTLYALDRESFLSVLNGHSRTRATAGVIVGEMRAADLQRENSAPAAE